MREPEITPEDRARFIRTYEHSRDFLCRIFGYQPNEQKNFGGIVRHIARLRQENNLQALPEGQGLKLLQDFNALMELDALASEWNTHPPYVTQGLGHQYYPYQPRPHENQAVSTTRMLMTEPLQSPAIDINTPHLAVPAQPAPIPTTTAPLPSISTAPLPMGRVDWTDVPGMPNWRGGLWPALDVYHMFQPAPGLGQDTYSIISGDVSQSQSQQPPNFQPIPYMPFPSQSSAIPATFPLTTHVNWGNPYGIPFQNFIMNNGGQFTLPNPIPGQNNTPQSQYPGPRVEVVPEEDYLGGLEYKTLPDIARTLTEYKEKRQQTSTTPHEDSVPKKETGTATPVGPPSENISAGANAAQDIPQPIPSFIPPMRVQYQTTRPSLHAKQLEIDNTASQAVKNEFKEEVKQETELPSLGRMPS
jgi:hypothetical protein